MIILLAFISCKKDEENSIQVETQTTEDPDYFQLEVGNYWVYENYKIDTGGVETKLTELDSIVIVGDTMYKGEKFFIVGSRTDLYGRILSYNEYTWWRDSSSYLINQFGTIRATYANYTDSFNIIYYGNGRDTTEYTYYQMTKPESQTTVPAGTFSVIDFLRKTTANIRARGGSFDPMFSHNQYAKGVGKVFSSYNSTTPPFIENNIIYEKRLVRYKVN